MITIVEGGHNKPLFYSGLVSQVVQQLMRQRLGILVRPCPSVYVEKHRRIPGLFSRQLIDSVQVHLEAGDVNRCLAGTWSVVV